MSDLKTIWSNYFGKIGDGTISFVIQFKEQLKAPFNSWEGYTKLTICEIDDFKKALDDPGWNTSALKSDIDAYFDFQRLHARKDGFEQLSRQEVIEGISPAHMVVESLMENEAQFPSTCSRTCGDGDIRDFFKTWSMDVVNSLGLLIDDRVKAVNSSEWKIYLALAIGVVTTTFVCYAPAIRGGLEELFHTRLNLPLSDDIMIVLGVFLAFFVTFLCGLAIWKACFDVESAFKRILSRFLNKTNQDSLTVGAAVNFRRERLDRIHEGLWEAATKLKEKAWEKGAPVEWPGAMREYVRAALWVNARGRGIEEFMKALRNFILMGYAAHTVYAEFHAHYKAVFLRRYVPRWWLDLLKWTFLIVTPVICLVSLNIATMNRHATIGVFLLDLVWRIGLPLSLTVYAWNGIKTIKGKRRETDLPQFVLANIRGAMPDAVRSPAEQLEKSVLEFVGHMGNRVLIEEEKH